MSFPHVPEPAAIAEHFCGALRSCTVKEEYYRRWVLKDVLPESLCVGVLVLPICPPWIDECGGVRDLNKNNLKRSFFAPKLREDFPACQAFAEAFQRPEVARLFSETLGIPEIDGSYLRIEYIQDTDGAWLEPHRDIHEKLLLHGHLSDHRPRSEELGHRYLRPRSEMVRPLFRRLQLGGDLHPRPAQLARLRQAAHHRRAPADGGQLRAAHLARPRSALLPGPARYASLTGALAGLRLDRAAAGEANYGKQAEK